MTNKDVRARGPQSAGGLRGIHRYACALAVATFVLIFAGGLVTSTGSALAVPDWPLSFGKFFPRMEGGVLYEHGHRMIAGTVAIMTLLMAVWAWRREERRFVRNLALFAFFLVIVQAVLGGLTVLLLLPLAIAVSHAATAQAFFCLTVALALLFNPKWTTLARIEPAGERPRLPLLAAATTAVIYIQILVGAVMRHMGAGLAIPDFPLAFGKILPPLESIPEQINFAHRVGAVVVTAVVCWTATAVLRSYGRQPLLRRPALAMLVLLALQITLGGVTILSARAVIPTTAHVAVGAALLATSLALTLRAYRLIDGRLVEQDGKEISALRAPAGAMRQRVTA
ncbi:MAG TPA: COX15/CtaA family protein [Candidatus Binataceae bacterium]|jgi:cytochrome c oxidase assembly protein subunit 15|nr:COX15/CtaA family protein [Candidatus Binataceae bacterium]